MVSIGTCICYFIYNGLYQNAPVWNYLPFDISIWTGFKCSKSFLDTYCSTDRNNCTSTSCSSRQNLLDKTKLRNLTQHDVFPIDIHK